MIRSLFLVAGELSSDRYAARLVTELRKRLPEFQAEAIGGPNLRDAGVPLFRDSSAWSAIGVAEALRRCFPIWLGHQSLKRRLKSNPPDLLILLDFGAFNVPTGNYARRLGIPVVYAIPPGSWRPDGGKVSAKLAACADAFLTPFQPSEQTLKAAGLDAHWLGHPLLDFLPEPSARMEMRRQLGIDPNRPVVAMLPGSRGQELQHIAPVMLEAANRLSERVEGLRFVLPLAPSLKLAGFEEGLPSLGWKRVENPDGNTQDSSMNPDSLSYRRYETGSTLFVVDGRAIETLAASDAAMICSGTATLEAALVGCPMGIGYHGGSAMNLEYLIRKAFLPKYIGLPNLLLDEPLCPELIREECNPERWVAEIEPLLTDERARSAQLEGFQRLRSRLGDPGVIGRWADFITQRWGEGERPSVPVNTDEGGAVSPAEKGRA